MTIREGGTYRGRTVLSIREGAAGRPKVVRWSAVEAERKPGTPRYGWMRLDNFKRWAAAG